MDYEERKKNTILAAVLALSPLLGIYSIGIPMLSLSQILTIVLLSICYYRHKGKIETFFVGFTIYAVLITIMNFVITPWTIIGDGIHDILSLLLYVFSLLGFINFADYNHFKIVLLKLGVISLFFFFFQYGLQIIGIGVSGIFPYLPLANDVSTTDMIAHKIESERNSGLFLEPAHYADFMIVILVFFLFKAKMSKMDVVMSLSIVISIFLSLSATGYAMMTIVLMYWLFVYRLGKSKYKFAFLAIAFIMVIAIASFISTNSNMMEVFGRYEELSGDVSNSVHGHSSFIRVMRGYIPFAESDFFYQIVGNGLGSLLGYVKAHPHSDYLALTMFNPNWINGFQYLIFTTGFVGAILYIKQLYRICRRTSVLGKAFFLVFAMLFLSSDSFFTQGLILYIIVKEKMQSV